MENENIKLRELSKEFFKNCITPTENDLYDFLSKKQWEIFIDYIKNDHKEKLIYELQSLDYKVNEIPVDTIDLMVERFQDILCDDDYRWVDCMNETISYFEEDLQEYKGEEQ